MRIDPKPLLSRAAAQPGWRPASRGALAVLLLTLASANLALAQEETFEGSAAVTLVEVPVNVVAKNGEPIRDLELEDFRVFDNGDRQTLAGLEKIDLEAIQPGRREVARTVGSMPSVARRHFLLLFDLTFSRPGNIIKAREAAREFVLEHLHPTDLAAVATFSLQTGPQLLVTFTPDRAQLARAIDTLGAPDLLRQRGGVDPLRFIIEVPESGGLDSDGSLDDAGPGGANVDESLGTYLSILAVGQERARQAYERGRITAWSRALTATARSLAAIDGRKHVVYFSEGFDGSLLFGRDASRDNSDANMDQMRREQGQLWLVDQDNTFGNSALQSDVNAMVEEFRRADCLIQAVDIGGLRVETDTAGMSANSVSSRLNDSQDALFYVADATGGTLFEDANNLGAQLESVLQRNSVTYVLSYYPKKLRPDGSYHKLKVKAELPRGARLSHRAGYYAPRSYSDLHPMERALMASEAIASPTPRQELDLAVLTAAFRATPERAYVPVILEVGGKSLLEGHTADNLDAELYIYATNSRGEMRDFLTQVVSFDLTQVRAAMRETGIKFYGHLDLEPDEYLIRVMVRNGTTGRTAVQSHPLTVPSFEDTPPGVLPPFFLERPNQWFMVREQRAAEQDTVIYPFTVNGEPFIPSARPAIAPGDGARFCLVGYNLGEGQLRLDGKVIGDEGVPHTGGSLALIERTATAAEGVDKLLASFDPEDLRSGDYTLEVAITNLDTGLQQQSSIPFRVR